MNARYFVLLVAICSLADSHAAAAEYGSVTGRFVYDGTPPTPKIIQLQPGWKCPNNKLVVEDLVVGKEGGIANVFIYLYVPKGTAPPAADPEVLKQLPENVVVENRDCRFNPHAVAVVAKRQGLLLRNVDTLAVNMRLNLIQNEPSNVLLPKGHEWLVKAASLADREFFPAKMQSDLLVGPESRVMVVDHPFVAISAADGKFKIAGIPPGKHTFRLWQETSGRISEMKQGGEKKNLDKGLIELEIPAGKTLDLGAILLSPKIFEPIAD